VIDARTSDPPVVSVVIPTYNRAHLLQRCLESVFGQTHTNLEVIVVDDGSTDATAEVLHGYGDQRVRVVSHRSSEGAAAARNRGLEHATGRFVAFLDSDDEWLPRKTERQLAGLRAGQHGLAYTGMWIVDGTTRRAAIAEPSGRAFEAMLSYQGPITTTGIMIDREVVGSEGHFHEAMPAMEERDLLIRVSRHHTIGRIPEPLYVRHVHDGPHISVPESQARGRRIIIERHAADLARRPRLKAFHYFRLALIEDRAGHTDRAREAIAAAAKADPSSVRLRLLNAAGHLGSQPLSVALKAYVAAGRLRPSSVGGAGTWARSTSTTRARLEAPVG
jgi:glycosyltransferase involved in cell wall biosynthesis